MKKCERETESVTTFVSGQGKDINTGNGSTNFRNICNEVNN